MKAQSTTSALPPANVVVGSKHFLEANGNEPVVWEWSAAGGGAWMKKSRRFIDVMQPDAAALSGWSYVGPVV